ncbi:MAG: DNA polymerase III subunit delta [Pseudorhodoplanes sp.]
MVALKASEIDSFIRRPDAGKPVILVFGPDAGLVRERAKALAVSAVDNPDDPFSLVRIEGDEIAADPARLADEANTIPLFGGRRAVWVKPTGRNILPSVEALLDAPPKECRVVIEAGDLRKNAPLRAAVERAKAGAAIPCYADGERDIERLIDEEMRAAGLTIAADARAVLLPLLGGDRQASRGELRKIALYAHGRKDVTLEDILAVVADASALALDGAIDAAFAGRLAEAESQYAKVQADGAAPSTILSAALRYLSQLHRMRLAVEEGMQPAGAVESARPPIHFKRKSLVETALRVWSTARLMRVMQQLAEAILETRRQPALAASIAQRTILSIAVNARRKE